MIHSHQEAIETVDLLLTRTIPEMNRKTYREQVTERMDKLLDMRNELVFQASLILMNQELELIEMEQQAFILE